MTSYIAYGESGKNKNFESQGEAAAFFKIGRNVLTRALEKGTPLEDPVTQEQYFIDEAPDDLAPEEEIRTREDWEDWD